MGATCATKLMTITSYLGHFATFFGTRIDSIHVQNKNNTTRLNEGKHVFLDVRDENRKWYFFVLFYTVLSPNRNNNLFGAFSFGLFFIFEDYYLDNSAKWGR